MKKIIFLLSLASLLSFCGEDNIPAKEPEITI